MAKIESSNITFAPASAAEPVRMAEWMVETGPEIFSYIFDGHDNAVRQLASHWEQPRGMFSHCHGTWAMHDETVIGLELGFTDAVKTDHREDTGMKFYTDLGPEDFNAQVARSMRVGPLMPDIPEDCYYVQHLVTAREVRGSGAGKALLQRAFETAKAAGHAAVHLDVMTNNPAQSFYRAMAMDPTLEIHLPMLRESIAMPGCIRMVKPV